MNIIINIFTVIKNFMIWFLYDIDSSVSQVTYNTMSGQDTLEEPVKKIVSTNWNCLSGNTHPISQEYCQCIQKNPIFFPVVSQK